MSPFVRVGCALAFSLAVGGCFKSDYPLITVSDSSTPVAEGRYTYTDSDKTEKSVIITHDGAVTKMTTIEEDGSAEIQNLLMRDIGNGYFIAMDAQSKYALLDVDGETITEFSESSYCDDFLEAIGTEGAEPSAYGVEVTGDNSPICTFSDFTNLANAMYVLDNHDLLDPIRVYHRQ